MGNVSPLTNIAGILLIVILILVGLGALATIFYGMRLRSKRRATDAQVAERGEDAGIEIRQVAAPDQSVAHAPPAPPPVAEQALASPPKPAIQEPQSAPELEPTPAPAHPPAAAKPIPDSLTTLKGLGPKVAARLSELGVTRFDQLAALTPDEAAALDAQLGSFSGRMARDRWIEQAGFLAAGDRAGFEAAFGKL